MITFDDMVKERKKHEEEEKEFRKKLNRTRIQELRDKGLEPMFDEDGNSLIPPKGQTYDHPNTMENSTATFFWIVSLVVGAIFQGALLIWVPATIIWWKFITRHNK